jgi:hypothetical protein
VITIKLAIILKRGKLFAYLNGVVVVEVDAHDLEKKKISMTHRELFQKDCTNN